MVCMRSPQGILSELSCQRMRISTHATTPYLCATDAEYYPQDGVPTSRPLAYRDTTFVVCQ